MYLKIIGCIGIVAATSGYGYSKGMEYQQQIKDTEELRSVILQLAAELKYTCAPLAQVCAAVSRRNSRIYREWLKHLEQGLESLGADRQIEGHAGSRQRRFAEIWEKECEKELSMLKLGNEERQRLSEIGRQLGSLDQRMEEQIFLQYAQFLEERRSFLLEKISEKRRICNLLGVTAGIFLVILIL